MDGICELTSTAPHPCWVLRKCSFPSLPLLRVWRVLKLLLCECTNTQVAEWKRQGSSSGAACVKGCSTEEQKGGGLPGARLIEASLLSISVERRRGRKAGKQEEWRLGAGWYLKPKSIRNVWRDFCSTSFCELRSFYV